VPHTDTHWDGITVELYLPPDDAYADIGATTQMRFIPNTGFAFAVGNDTWHSADTVGRHVTSRDSILLTYFVDQGVARFLKNPVKRAGNFLDNERRSRFRTGRSER
jgi:hypothetical protein